MPVFDGEGNPVTEVHPSPSRLHAHDLALTLHTPPIPYPQTVVKDVKNKITGEIEQEQVCKPVLNNRRFLRGDVTADGPLSPLIGWAVGQKQFLMERGVWPEGGLKGKCGAKAKDHTATCCATGLMYHQPDFQVNTSKLEELIRSAGHTCLFLPRFVIARLFACM